MEPFITSINPGQWAIVATILVGFATAFFKYRPAQTRAQSEAAVAQATVIAAAKVAAAAAVAEAKLADGVVVSEKLRELRTEVHGYKNEVAKLITAQAKSDHKVLELEKLLHQALSISSVRRGQMDTLFSLIELLISELERIDPKSIIVPQAKLMLRQVRDASVHGDAWKSDALNNAEHADHDAKQTARSTETALDEVRASEARTEAKK